MSKQAHTPSTNPNSYHWTQELLRYPTGSIRPLLANAVAALEYAPEWCGTLGYDAFEHRIFSTPECALGAIEAWTDNDDSKFTVWLQEQGVYVNSKIASQAVLTVSRKNTVHSGQVYLDSLVWDGQNRLEYFPSRILGCDPKSTYEGHAFAAWLTAAAARMYLPGAKVDIVLILEGKQGIGKSSLLRALCPKARWFLDTLPDLHTRDAIQLLTGVWMVELGELTVLLSSRSDAAKAFISRQTDRYRLPYDRHPEAHPRHCVFAGTTNDDQYPRDPTANRRFLPLALPDAPIPADNIWRVRDQLLAEAVHRFKHGAQWWSFTPKFTQHAESEQKQRLEEDPWLKPVSSYLNSHSGSVIISDILNDGLLIPMAQQTPRSVARVAAILRSLGYQRLRKGPHSNRARSWEKIE